MKKIHILNGDCLKSHWPALIEGDLIVARECLIDGNVQGETLAELFINRAKFIASYEGFTTENYYLKTVVEFDKITSIQPKTQVYCWFEHDLFCQVNFWFVSYLLDNHIKGCEIYFVGPNEGNEYSFAYMSKKELITAYNNALLITSNELKILSQLWPLYQGLSSRNNYQKMSGIAENLKHKFPFLPAAISAQQERTPDELGYGRPERRLLALIAELNTTDFKKIFYPFSNTEAIYSFGDMQVKRMLDDLLIKKDKEI